MLDGDKTHLFIMHHRKDVVYVPRSPEGLNLSPLFIPHSLAQPLLLRAQSVGC